ncbi:hypothetical protein VTH06DRAFT_6305 [Thermothelomyces fergusii]
MRPVITPLPLPCGMPVRARVCCVGSRHGKCRGPPKVREILLHLKGDASRNRIEPARPPDLLVVEDLSCIELT